MKMNKKDIKDMTTIVNKKKELKIFLENRIFNIEEDYVLTSDKKKSMEASKIIYLYLLIATKTGIASNKLDCNIALLLKWQGLSEHADSIKLTRERLNYLVEQNFISVDVDIMKAKKNDLIEIEILVSNCSYTIYTEKEIEIFNKLEGNRAVVFMYLIRYRHKTYGYTFTSLLTMAVELKMSKVTILDCIKELVDRKFITIDNPNFYTVDKNTGGIRKSNNTYLFNSDDKKENTYENKKIDLNKYKTVNYHPMSTNFLYETNKITGAIIKTKAYRRWINDFPLEELKGFEDIDWNKKVYLSMQIIAKDGYDTDNCIKSFQDMLSKYYNKGEDNKVQLSNINIIARCEEYEEGKIFFYLEN